MLERAVSKLSIESQRVRVWMPQWSLCLYGRIYSQWNSKREDPLMDDMSYISCLI